MPLYHNDKIILHKNDKSSCIVICENCYNVKVINNKNDMIKAHKLRYTIFCQELGWVPLNASMLEIDDYDNDAISLGLFDSYANLKAYLRIILSDYYFMLEREFPFLVKNVSEIRKEQDTIEISRLCVAPGARSNRLTGNFDMHSLSMLLYKGVYRWCLQNNKRYVVLVVDQNFLNLLNSKGFPCRLIGKPYIMPDKIVAVAAILDWREFENINRIQRSEMMAWFSQLQLGLPTMQLQQHGFC